ncbi:GNAT family N-acetyltransferase [Yoonia sp. BS5-3]|uniref:GNAT family N-acetyltransferase n=1 Tax=Yoonia phaeophyticola TaxID=3137369 RepID=A0ABZ2V0M9_9RHOB
MSFSPWPSILSQASQPEPAPSAPSNDPELIAKLVKICGRGPMQDLVGNLDASMDVTQAGGIHMPVSLSSGRNCYICDPGTAYIDYAIEETRHFTTKPWVQKPLLGLIAACRPLLALARLDHQVQANNWLFSTNPVPPLTQQSVAALRDDMIQAHHDRAIVIRSLNAMADNSSIDALKGAGFALLPSRQIYVLDPAADQSSKPDIKRDAKLLADSPYRIVPAASFSANDFSRAEQLYNMLYLDKYTQLNPHYTASFLAQAHQIGLLEIIGLRGPDDQLDGVIGLFSNGNTMTVPILGYDISKPQETGLYRMLNSLGQQRAAKTQQFYNMSAGAASFKRHRGAVATIEYTAVYVRHLKWRQRIATRVIKALLTTIGVRVLRRFAL